MYQNSFIKYQHGNLFHTLVFSQVFLFSVQLLTYQRVNAVTVKFRKFVNLGQYLCHFWLWMMTFLFHYFHYILYTLKSVCWWQFWFCFCFLITMWGEKKTFKDMQSPYVFNFANKDKRKNKNYITLSSLYYCNVISQSHTHTHTYTQTHTYM